ncbi:MAG: RNA polymerase sigma factor region1.1 domain-containing protein, partial [Desulfobacteraceae bacterium]
MANDSDMVSLKRLIDTGKDKGYITYEELNDDLPEDVVSSEYIDDLMMMFEELDIMVIDEASKEEIEKSKKLKKKQKKAQEKENYRAQLSDTGARVSDPVKMYLKEMGCISLLTREGEVEIAKRIEAGEQEALDTLLECHVGIEHIIELGRKLEAGEVKLKDVINDMDDDEDSQLQLSEKKKSMLTLIEEIESLYDQCREAQREISKPRCSAAKKKKLTAKIEKNREKIVGLINSFTFEKRQLDYMVEKLRDVVSEVDDVDQDMAACMLKAGGKPIAHLKKCINQIPKSAKDNQVVTPLKMKKCELLELKTTIDSAQKCLKDIKERTSMSQRELKEALARVEESLEKSKLAK